MKWLWRMFRKHDPDIEKMSRELYTISSREVLASKRLDNLAELERQARLRSLAVQAEVLSRSDRRVMNRRSRA